MAILISMSETKTEHTPELVQQAAAVLQANDRGNYTVPATHLYPHQWLWDSCFVAIGLRWLDVERAKLEIMSLLAGQWSNGMIPHMIFNQSPRYRRDRAIWRSWLNPDSPDDVATSGITQPPVIAEAVVRVGERLPAAERRSWYKAVLPALVRYHQWLYRERDPHGEGLVLLVHPWETGLDNTPPWMAELHEHLLPWWVRVLEKTRLVNLLSLARRDTRIVPVDQRFDNVEALTLFDVQRRLRRKLYESSRILDHSLFAIEDAAFNSILIRANEHLVHIAETIHADLPEDLLASMERARTALEGLWDAYGGQYFSRDFISHRLLKHPSIATLLPLYAGSITKSRARELVKLLESEHQFGSNYPVPSVPVSSSDFQAERYWQGPTWVNMNWLIIDGLERYGFTDHAAALRETTLDMVARSGCAEYFDPLTGSALGAPDFSWTAALALDLTHHS